jgi:hypothetical protein
MKMGTIVSPSRYDDVLGDPCQPANLRQPATLRYASRGCLLDSQGGPVTVLTQELRTILLENK